MSVLETYKRSYLVQKLTNILWKRPDTLGCEALLSLITAPTFAILAEKQSQIIQKQMDMTLFLQSFIFNKGHQSRFETTGAGKIAQW